MKKTSDLKVFITTRDSVCDECGENLGRRAWITLIENKGALCLSCADLDHLAFLPAGDAALTRRSRKYSTAEHACLKYSGRVGRSAAAKNLDAQAIKLAVIAHIRHTKTPYDKLLAKGYDRWDARKQVEETVDRILAKWKNSM